MLEVGGAAACLGSAKWSSVIIALRSSSARDAGRGRRLKRQSRCGRGSRSSNHVQNAVRKIACGRRKGDAKMEFTLGNFELMREDLEEARQRCSDQRRVLEKAIDKLAAIGIITDTPHCKHLYMSREREL